MSIERRSVLQGMVLSGAALALSQAGLAHAAHTTSAVSRQPVLLLVSDAEAQTAFIDGVKANPSVARVTVLKAQHDLDFIAAFQQRLSASKGERIIGLVDDASGMLLLDLARSAGARVHWTGQLVTQNGVSRHRVAAIDNSANCIKQFAEFAENCSRPTAMTEQTLSASRQWASSLGFALASPEPNRRYLRTTPPTYSSAVDGHFVSFSIET